MGDMRLSWKGKKDVWKNVHNDLNLRLLKMFLKKMPLPDVELPELSRQESQFIQEIKKMYLECLESSEKDIQKVIPSSNINNLKQLVEKVFNLLSLMAEVDSFYRDRIIDFFYLIFFAHDNNKKKLGADYFQNYISQRNKVNISINKNLAKEHGNVDKEKGKTP